MTPPASSPGGLEGVVAGASAKSRVFGQDGRLFYCGYPVEALAEEGAFEECIYLLWNGELPNEEQLAAFNEELSARAEVSKPIWDVHIQNL